jgi:hypothetical protein
LEDLLSRKPLQKRGEINKEFTKERGHRIITTKNECGIELDMLDSMFSLLQCTITGETVKPDCGDLAISPIRDLALSVLKVFNEFVEEEIIRDDSFSPLWAASKSKSEYSHWRNEVTGS